MKTSSALVLFTFTLFFTPFANGAVRNERFELLLSDRQAYDNFGHSVAMSGNVAIVGALGDDGIGFATGSAYLYDVTSGTQAKKLTPNDPLGEHYFGYSVAISDNTAIVSAPRDDDKGSDSGAAYLFNVTTGAQLAKLTSADGMARDRFGNSVGISGNTAIVGVQWDDVRGEDSGSAYLFDVLTGTQRAKLAPTDGRSQDLFGYAVAINGNTAIVGAMQDDDKGVDSGSAYLFDVTTGTQLAKLTATDGAKGALFGASVAISGNMAIVGAPWDNGNSQVSGSAYLFDVTTGTQLAKLTPSGITANDWFGHSVGISGNTAIVGAIYDDDKGQDSGSAYLFDIATGVELAKFVARNGAQGHSFGGAVGITDSAAIVGAYGYNSNGLYTGSAYIFSTIPEPSSLCLAISVIMVWSARRAG